MKNLEQNAKAKQEKDNSSMYVYVAEYQIENDPQRLLFISTVKNDRNESDVPRGAVHYEYYLKVDKNCTVTLVNLYRVDLGMPMAVITINHQDQRNAMSRWCGGSCMHYEFIYEQNYDRTTFAGKARYQLYLLESRAISKLFKPLDPLLWNKVQDLLVKNFDLGVVK